MSDTGDSRFIPRLQRGSRLWSMPASPGLGGTAWHPEDDDRWSFYATGYKMAADLVVDQVKTGHGYQRFLISPIMFLFRHSLELSVKRLFLAARRLLGSEEPPDAVTSLPLEDLWEICRVSLAQVLPAGALVELELIDLFINDFCHEDAVISSEDDSKKAAAETVREGAAISLPHVQQLVGNASALLRDAESILKDRLQLNAKGP